MSNNDKVLAGMAAAAVTLAVIAFAVALRQPAPDYRPSDASPGDVVNNYLLALRLGDNVRAYGYLSSELDGYPADLETFVEDMATQRWKFPVEESAADYTISDIEVTGNVAVVSVEETRFNENGLFDSGQINDDFVVTLRNVDGEWRLTHGESYWSDCWGDPGSERCRRGSDDSARGEDSDGAGGADGDTGAEGESGEGDAP